MAITVNLRYTGTDGNARKFAEEMISSGTVDAIRAEEKAWSNYNSFPETYRRIRVDFIQGYRQSGREEETQKALRKFIQYCHDGKMLPGWDDFGRLK